MKKINPYNRLVIFAGPNGSGKSTITEIIKKNNLLPELYLNPDVIAKEINPSNVWAARIEAARKVLEKRESYLTSNKSFSMETTLSGVSEMSFIKKAIAQGYKTSVFYVAIDNASENISRVVDRVNKGGHDVPTNDVLRRRERSLKNLSTIIELVPRILVIDNTKNQKVILKKNNNKITFVSEELPKWFTSNISKEKLDNYRAESKQKLNSDLDLSKTYFCVPAEDYKLIKSFGARWDRKVKYWYVPQGKDLTPFDKRWKRIDESTIEITKNEKLARDKLRKELKVEKDNQNKITQSNSIYSAKKNGRSR